MKVIGAFLAATVMWIFALVMEGVMLVIPLSVAALILIWIFAS